MVFLALLMLGWWAWNPIELPASRLPVELLPPVSGDELFVSFGRPGSEPEVVEREILLPLEARVSELSGVAETRAEIRGSGGNFRVRFEPGTDLQVRELEIPACISDTMTLSTMHGCPPEEIEQITLYLLQERKLHTSVKCNPTLLGPDRVRAIITPHTQTPA